MYITLLLTNRKQISGDRLARMLLQSSKSDFGSETFTLKPSSVRLEPKTPYIGTLGDHN